MVDLMGCSRGKASPNKQTQLRLFADSAGHCQRPECRDRLFVDTGTTTVHVAEMAHIFAASDRGPRAESTLTAEERGAYENLVLLCSNCHTIVDKSSFDFSDATIARWKQEHAALIASAFGAIKYLTRRDARDAIEAPLLENRIIFTDIGPDNDYKFDPESDLAAAWQRKVKTTILPNNRKVLMILSANRHLLIRDEPVLLERFRQHVKDLEARHIGQELTQGTRFPHGMDQILEDT